MKKTITQLKQNFSQGLSQISHFWGFPKGMGAIFGVLYLSPSPMSLDELVHHSGLTKGAVSTNVRALARMGLVHLSTRLGDRKDYYTAETDFYKSIRTILKERQNSEFERAISSVRETLDALEAQPGITDETEQKFLLNRLRALQSFFDALDGLVKTIIRMEGLGSATIKKIITFLK